MPPMAQQVSLPSVGGFNFNQFVDEWKAKYEKWLATQHPAVEVLMIGAQSAVQGAMIGYLLGTVSNMNPDQQNANPQMQQQLQALNAGGPLAQARNLAVMTGVNSALSAAIKKARKGKEDVWGAMAASFGAGACFAIVSGLPNPAQSAISTGVAFAAFNGLFYQIGKAFTPQQTDDMYVKGTYMLKTLGLSKFDKNLKKGELTDDTIMLWNDRALQEARIPPGPRLLILHHLDQFRGTSGVLKPAVPVPSYPGHQWPAPQQLTAA